MCVPNLVPIGPQTATCIRLEGYTHTHTLLYIDIDNQQQAEIDCFNMKQTVMYVHSRYRQHENVLVNVQSALFIKQCSGSTTLNGVIYICEVYCIHKLQYLPPGETSYLQECSTGTTIEQRCVDAAYEF